MKVHPAMCMKTQGKVILSSDITTEVYQPASFARQRPFQQGFSAKMQVHPAMCMNTKGDVLSDGHMPVAGLCYNLLAAIVFHRTTERACPAD
jgi:hypothetical protein